MSESHKNIYQALLEAQRSMGNAIKGSDNPAFKSKYADLNSVREAVMPSLIAQDICVVQPEVVIDGRNYVRTTLIHAPSETMIHSDVEILYTKANDPRAQGSAITYARRYGLQSLCAIGAEDDDGNGAAGRAPKSPEAEPRAEPKTEPKTEQKPDFKPAWLDDSDKMNAMFAKLDRSKEPPEKKIRGWYLISDELLKRILEQYQKHRENGATANNNGQ